MHPAESEEADDEKLVPSPKRISGDRSAVDLGAKKMRIAQSKPLLARSREKENFLQRAECGQSTQIITVAECRSDFFQTGISLFDMQPASKTAEKDPSPTDVFLSDKFP